MRRLAPIHGGNSTVATRWVAWKGFIRTYLVYSG